MAFWRRARRWDWALIGIVALAAALRFWRPGLYRFWWDEFRLLDDSLRLARYGEWTWLSHTTTWQGLPYHSPLNVYIISLLYLFIPDPRAPRLLVALMCTAAVGLMYVTVLQHFGRRAAGIAGLLFAVSVSAVDWSRWAWNPNIAQFFAALWLFTGLSGCCEGCRWARIGHWAVLGLAIQAHPGNVMLVPVSLFLAVIAWNRESRRRLFWDTAWGWALAGLTFVPWMIGLASVGSFSSSVRFSGVSFSLHRVFDVFARVVGGAGFRAVEQGWAGALGWWPPLWMHEVLRMQAWLALFGAVGLLIYGVRQERFPYVVVALVTLAPLFAFVISPLGVSEYFLAALMFGAYPALGVALAWLAKQHKALRVLVAAVVVAFVAAHLWLLAGFFRWLDMDGVREPFRAPMDFHLALLDEWHTLSESGEIVVVAETTEVKYGPQEQRMFWEVLGTGYPLRFVEMAQGVPVSPEGQVVVSTVGGETVPALFGEGDLAGKLYDGTPVFRVVVLPQDYQVDLAIFPEEFDRFSNGAHILGIEPLTDLQAGGVWKLVLAWQPECGPIEEQYQFSLRLVDSEGRAHGQYDAASLDGRLWRSGDLALNLVSFPVDDTLPASGTLRMQVLMYTYPDMKNADALDDAGNPAGHWIYLMVPR